MEENYLGKKTYGTMQGGEPVEITEMKTWLQEMIDIGATHVVCNSFMSAYKILTEEEILKDNIDKYEAMLAEMKAKYEANATPEAQ